MACKQIDDLSNEPHIDIPVQFNRVAGKARTSDATFGCIVGRGG